LRHNRFVQPNIVHFFENYSLHELLLIMDGNYTAMIRIAMRANFQLM